MNQKTYSASDLAGVLRSFEHGYGVSSAEFYRAHVENDESVVGRIPGAHRQAWAGFYSEWERMSTSSSFSARVERELEPA